MASKARPRGNLGAPRQPKRGGSISDRRTGERADPAGSLPLTCRANPLGLVWAGFRWVAKGIFFIIGFTCWISVAGPFLDVFFDFFLMFSLDIFDCFFDWTSHANWAFRFYANLDFEATLRCFLRFFKNRVVFKRIRKSKNF